MMHELISTLISQQRHGLINHRNMMELDLADLEKRISKVKENIAVVNEQIAVLSTALVGDSRALTASELIGRVPLELLSAVGKEAA